MTDIVDDSFVDYAIVTSDVLFPEMGDTPLHTLDQVATSDRVAAEAAIDEAVEEEEDFDSEPTPDICDSRAQIPNNRKLVGVNVELPKSTLLSPRSVFDGFIPPAPLVTESSAVQKLLEYDKTQQDDDYIEFELDQFSCYIDNDRFAKEMRALHCHAQHSGREMFYFDGILRVGDAQYYVQRVKFEQIPLGNYGTAESTVGDQLWIRSELHAHPRSKRDIYYRLKTPTIEYERFHKTFLWVADLAKHIVDYCDFQTQNGRHVYIRDFRQDFGNWIQKMHKDSVEFQRWYAKRSCDDFRQPIIANGPFIHKELVSLLNTKQLALLHVLKEIARPLGLYPRQDRPAPVAGVPQTIVTPYIYECFSHMSLDQLLKPVEPSVSIEEAIRRSWPEDTSKALAFTREARIRVNHEEMIESIKPGDLISTPPDEEESGTRWRTENSDKKWYGLVQKVHVTKHKRHYDVTWLYQPEDTPCCSMKYPWKKELFLSNHCTCDQGAQSKVRDDQVLDIHNVEWFGSPETKAEFFVRQIYITEERRFVTLQQKDLKCTHSHSRSHSRSHMEVQSPKYSVGDTVLVLLTGTDRLEPFELLEYVEENKTVCLRRLRRRQEEFGGDCASNELIYTEEKVYSAADRIVLKCIIRFYSPKEQIPAPYNRNGTGNAFFISHRLLDDGSLQPLGSNRPSLRQGFDPNKPSQQKKLRGLDLFSGGGNMGRGFEDGGAVEAKWANDIDSLAIHTYMANTKEPHSVNPFLGSVDDFLLDGLEGRFSKSVPRPGLVQFISGGSPCPGFSLVTLDKTAPVQIKNRSLVASFASCIDFWRPLWGVLENVKSIVQSPRNGNQREDFFSQLICALVGMGYQTQIILGDAWAHGAPQTRVRAFLVFAAPGVRLPTPPYPSHSNPQELIGGGLGKMTNGEPYVQRSSMPTAFKYVSAAEATADLPDIYDAKTDTCVPFPDHRLSITISSGKEKRSGGKNRRTQIFNIPIRPYHMSFSKAWLGDPKDMFDHERDAFPTRRGMHRLRKESKAWGRAHPHKPFSTVTTFCHMADARVGGNLTHWDQPRPLSIMEARRAQGIPDDEVLLGAPTDQWKLVGNGVARQISMALGLALREVWAGSLYEDSEEAPALHSVGDHSSVPLDPWADQCGQGILGDDDDHYQHEREKEVIKTEIGGTDTSRSSSRIPGFTDRDTETPLFETAGGYYSSTSATSLADGRRDGRGSSSRKKRPSASQSPMPKKARVGEESKDYARLGDTVSGEPLLVAPSGATVVRLSSEELVGDFH